MLESVTLARRILWGLVIGVIAAVVTLAIGHFQPSVLTVMRRVSTAVFDPLGQVFLRMLFFVVILLVFTSLASGVTQLGRLDRLGPLAGRTFVLFFANMLIAVAIGLVMMNVVEPGHHLDTGARTQLMSEYGASADEAIERKATQPAMSFATLVEMFMPRNLFGAVVGSDPGKLGDVLPLILFAILVGAAATQLARGERKRIQRALDTVTDLMTRIVAFALALAPIAVPAMIYSVIVKVGVDVLLALAVFVLGCLVALALHLLGTMSLWLRFLARRSPWAYFRQIRSLLIAAFSTSSSTSVKAYSPTSRLSLSTSGSLPILFSIIML